MSTRATYEIREGGNSHTFYIHHDGYPAGAAVYFQNMLKANGASLASRFIRGNERAEFTAGHEAHGDTEFKYTLTRTGEKLFITYAERQPNGHNWNLSKKMSIADFFEPFARGTSPTFEVIEPCTPEGLLWSQLLKDVEDSYNSVGLILYRGVIHRGMPVFPDISNRLRDLEYMRKHWDGEELACGPIFVPRIDTTVVTILEEILRSEEFQEHLELRRGQNE